MNVREHPIPILLYHSIADESPAELKPFSTTPEDFERQLSFLWDHGFQTLTVSEFVRRSQTDVTRDSPVALITFDDGFADTHNVAAPALLARDMVATVYVTTGHIDSHTSWLDGDGKSTLVPMLSSHQIKSLADAGFEIGAHTVNHPELDVISVTKSRKEIEESKSQLESILGANVSSFAYPHGYHSQRTKSLVRQAGFTNAVAVKNQVSSPSDDQFALARLTIMNDHSVADLQRLIGGPVGTARERLQTKAWRQYRRMRRWKNTRL